MNERAAIPMLSYEDVAAAVDWLSDAFGFREVGERYTDDDGRVSHAEIERDGALVYLGWPGEDYESPPTTRNTATTRHVGHRCPSS